MILKTIVALMFGMTAWGSLAAGAVSSRFTLDSHYEPSGEVFRGNDLVEVCAGSARWTLLTIAQVSDSDEDGMPDEWEQYYGLSVNRANAGEDPDGDGWTNLQEYNAGMNPVVADNALASVATSDRWLADTWIKSTANGEWTPLEVWASSGRFDADTAGRAPDTDKDGLPDWWEKLYGLDSLVDDALADPDGDGRLNVQEYNAGTSPISPDVWSRSVSEGLDSFECDTRILYTGGNPSFDTAFAVIEIGNCFVCDTGGLYYDWDGDGIPNWWEARYSRGGSKTELVAEEDDDVDGMSNYKEFVAYTDPTDDKSKFVIELKPIRVELLQSKKLMSKVFTATANDASDKQGFKLTWQSAKGRTYGVYTCANLALGWSDKPDVELLGTGDVMEFVPPVVKSAMFFKVTVRLADDY